MLVSLFVMFLSFWNINLLCRPRCHDRRKVQGGLLSRSRSVSQHWRKSWRGIWRRSQWDLSFLDTRYGIENELLYCYPSHRFGRNPAVGYTVNGWRSTVFRRSVGWKAHQFSGLTGKSKEFSSHSFPCSWRQSRHGSFMQGETIAKLWDCFKTFSGTILSVYQILG